MSYNPAILTKLLAARSLTREQLAERLSLGVADLNGELGRKPEPKQGILNSIAKELSLPPFVFFMAESPELEAPIPDFRSPKPTNTPKSRPTIETIQLAASVQQAVEEVEAPGSAPNLPKFSADLDDRGIDALALRARNYFGISLADQVNSKDARTFYVLCRKKIEDKGIFVFQESFPEVDGSGFCLAHNKYPIIVINTKQQTRARRLFTLIHELAHVLMGKTGISDPFVRRNVIERQCNRFAGSFLVPATYLAGLLGNATLSRNPDLDDVRWASHRLKTSQEAAVLRLEQLGLYSPGSHSKWVSLIHNIGNPDFKEKGGGAGGPPPQEKVKLAKYGFRFATAFEPALKSGLITELNLFRTSGLKPKYQKQYFDYTKSLTDTELRSLELDDE